ncbi:hypothetical protein A3G69_00930 [Candidatus Peribacteria bacterium RIFCSPLOWO2_12_FULL_53_10]|nr:MAG: hypothetical protein A3G69_00930 [Candidatus Peribacteria bacterium RIFCSPLOWO2_12_FULL_53_10]
MQRHNYPLKKYIKAVEKIAEEKGLALVKVTATKGSIVRFELFERGEHVPMSIWTIHHEHNKKQIVWSKDDYRKAADRLVCTYEEFIQRLDAA